MAATVNRLAKPYRPGDLEAPVGSILPEDGRVDTKNTVHERPLVAMSSAPLMSIIRSTDYAQAGMDLYWSFLYLHLKKKSYQCLCLEKAASAVRTKKSHPCTFPQERPKLQRHAVTLAVTCGQLLIE